MPSETEPPLCKVCKMTAIPGCRNTLQYPSGGAILMHRGERLVSVDCPNMRVVSLRKRLTDIDPQFLKVPHYAQTPLYQANQVDRTQDNLFIRHVHWQTFLAHFKWVIASQKPGFFVRVVTDMTLLNVFLGNASVKYRLESQRNEDGELLVSNSLEDLLSSVDLAVLRLGFLAHKNRAAANMLREALSLRLGLGKPTWLIEPLEQTFMPEAMTCCDDNVLALVQSSFEEVHLDPPRPVRPAYVEDEDGVTVPGVPGDDREEVPIEDVEQAVEELPKLSSAVDADEVELMMRPSKKRPWKPARKRWT